MVRVAGPDRLTWLHSLTSQHLEHLAPGVPTEALSCRRTATSSTRSTWSTTATATWAHVEPGTAEALVGYLDRMRFWSKVEVEDVSAAVRRGAATPLGRARRTAVAGPTRARGASRSCRAASSATVLAGPLAGIWALEALRIAAGRPRLGLETDHRTIPHEIGWLDTAVHLDKGCYRGQETVARVHNLGRPPRRLVLLHLDGSESVLPAPAEPVLLGDRRVGRVTSSARHYELGPVALAVVKRSTPVDAPLVAGGVAAAQEVVVPA